MKSAYRIAPTFTGVDNQSAALKPMRSHCRTEPSSRSLGQCFCTENAPVRPFGESTRNGES